ncbi:hypothetical protein J6590_038017 [Homalodisca vitripennis]|nr:hypothetical protein J6590_038017 [Homalodisca vitripennis]
MKVRKKILSHLQGPVNQKKVFAGLSLQEGTCGNHSLRVHKHARCRDHGSLILVTTCSHVIKPVSSVRGHRRLLTSAKGERGAVFEGVTQITD